MKKKFLSFIFAICLIFPCVFTLSACGKNPPSETVTLAGKTIVLDSCSDITWSEIAISNLYFDGEKQFSINLTLAQFVERYWETEVISDIVGNNDYSSLTQAKQALTDAVKVKVATYSPKITISADETTAVIEYDYPGCSEPVKNCTVQRMESQSNQASYELYYGGNPIGTINYMNGVIDCATDSDYLFIYYLLIDLSEYTSIPMELVAEDGSGDTCQWTLSQSNDLNIYTEIIHKYKIETK